MEEIYLEESESIQIIDKEKNVSIELKLLKKLERKVKIGINAPRDVYVARAEREYTYRPVDDLEEK